MQNVGPANITIKTLLISEGSLVFETELMFLYTNFTKCFLV